MNQQDRFEFVVQGVPFPAPRLAAGLYLVATPIGKPGGYHPAGVADIGRGFGHCL